MGRHTETFDIPEAYRVQRPDSFEFRHAKSKDKKSKKPKSPLWARLCVIFGSVFIVMASLAYGGHLFLEQRYDKNIKRADLLGNNRQENQGKNVKFPLNFLIIGTDKRTPEDYDPNDPSSRTASVKGERSDTIMLVHIPQDKSKAYVVSIPRDTDVEIPPSADGHFKGGKDKINAAYFFGGAPLLVSTINKLMGVTIDYPIIVHFKAVRELADTVGGVDVVIDKQVQDPRTKIIFQAGPQHLDGKTAEAYVRQRYGLPNGDYDRQKRQQQFVFALMNRITQTHVMTSPLKLDKLLRVVTSNITVDQSMPVQDMALALKGLSP
ncbi:MAG: LCP family protein [Mycobacteriales bacterium]